MSTALRSVGLLDVLSSTPAEPSVARLVSMPVCTASLRNLVRNAGQDKQHDMGSESFSPISAWPRTLQIQFQTRHRTYKWNLDIRLVFQNGMMGSRAVGLRRPLFRNMLAASITCPVSRPECRGFRPCGLQFVNLPQRRFADGDCLLSPLVSSLFSTNALLG